MTNMFTGAYHETDDFGVITKVNGLRTIAEIDGVPAAKKYQEWTGCSDDDIAGGNLLAYSIPRRSASRTVWAIWSPSATR